MKEAQKNNTLREILGLESKPVQNVIKKSDSKYRFNISNPHKDVEGEYVMQMGQVFAMLLPKDPKSAKFRGYELSVPPFTIHNFAG